jgi:hypothetical protein
MGSCRLCFTVGRPSGRTPLRSDADSASKHRQSGRCGVLRGGALRGADVPVMLSPASSRSGTSSPPTLAPLARLNPCRKARPPTWVSTRRDRPALTNRSLTSRRPSASNPTSSGTTAGGENPSRFRSRRPSTGTALLRSCSGIPLLLRSRRSPLVVTTAICARLRTASASSASRSLSASVMR